MKDVYVSGLARKAPGGADRGIKEAAELALQNMGMSLSTGINVFLTQVARDQMLPFRPGEDLEVRYRNRKLTGRYRDCFECHVEPDWSLIYRRDVKQLVLLLVETGSYSDLVGK